MYYLNPNVETLNRVFDQNKREGYLRLDLNENPGGLPDALISKVLEDISPEFVSQYPETLEFTTMLANYLNAELENICLVNGSAEGIRYIIEAFTSPNGKIVGVSPSYAMFEVYAKMYGRTFIPVEYTSSLDMPIENIIKKLDEDVELLILLNPNNPMGNVYTRDEMQYLLDMAEKMEITVLIDEAYYYFYPETFIDFALNRKHVFVTRTFSKLFSMAGCRLGYVVGWPEGIQSVQKLCTPHNVNAFALKFAEAVIETDGMIEQLTALYSEGKSFLTAELDKRKYVYNCKEGNFIFIKPKTDANTLVQRMKDEKKILIKTYNGIGALDTCLRVTIGEKKYMQQFLTALDELDL